MEWPPPTTTTTDTTIAHTRQALVMSEDYKAGQALVEEGEYEPVQRDVQQLLEVARRHKIMNPGAYSGSVGG